MLFKPINKISKYLLLQELLPIEVNILTQFPPIISGILSNHSQVRQIIKHKLTTNDYLKSTKTIIIIMN